MINHNTLTEQTEQLPPDIFQAVANLEEVQGMHRSNVIGFQLSIGVQGLEGVAKEEIASSTAAFVNYMSYTLDFNSRSRAELDESTKRSAADFAHWMPVARKNFPELAASVGKQVFDIAKAGFNYEAYSALELDYGSDLNKAIHLIASHAANIVKNSPDVQDIKDFLDSDLRKVTSPHDIRGLKSEIIRRDGLNDNSAKAMAEFLDKELGKSFTFLGNQSNAEWVAEHSPELLLGLATKYGRHAEEIRAIIAQTLPTNKQENHREALEVVEASMLEDIAEVDYLARLYYPTNPDHAFKIIESALEKDWHRHYEEDDNWDQYKVNRFYERIVRTAIAIAPDDKLLDLLDKFPETALSHEARSILVRRLASPNIGDTERALELVDLSPELLMDTSLKENEPVRNLLAVFEETGDNSVLQEAERRIQELKNKSYHDDVALHEFAVRKFMAATKHNDESLAEAALTEMEQSHQSDDTYYVKKRSLEMSMKAFIDLGDYGNAEACAKRLFEINYSDGGVDWNHNAMREMISAYMSAGQKDHAANLVREHYFNGQAANYHGLWAVETLAKGYLEHGGLHFKVLNSYTDWHTR